VFGTAQDMRKKEASEGEFRTGQETEKDRASKQELTHWRDRKKASDKQEKSV